MKIRPIFDRVLLECEKKEEKTLTGIYLAPSTDEDTQIGIVKAVGEGVLHDGKKAIMQVKKGDKIIYSKFSGTTVKDNDKEYLIIRQADILAVIE